MLFPSDTPSVLIVDDNPMFRLILQTLLSQWGDTDIYQADNVEEAIEIIKSNDIDIVTIDIFMPHLTGFDLYDWIYKYNNNTESNIRTIGITAFPDNPQLLEPRYAGMTPIIPKPVNPDMLINTFADKWL